MAKERERKETVDEPFQSETPEEFSIELNRLGTLDENTHIPYDGIDVM
jgi:hypothetical protein